MIARTRLIATLRGRNFRPEPAGTYVEHWRRGDRIVPVPSAEFLPEELVRALLGYSGLVSAEIDVYVRLMCN